MYYALWGEIERRVAEQAAPQRETLDAFKERLRRTALAIPKGVVFNMLGSMVARTHEVYQLGARPPRTKTTL